MIWLLVGAGWGIAFILSIMVALLIKATERMDAELELLQLDYEEVSDEVSYWAGRDYTRPERGER